VTNWSAFVGLTGVVLVLLLALARLSQDTVHEDTPDSKPELESQSNATGIDSNTTRSSSDPVEEEMDIGAGRKRETDLDGTRGGQDTADSEMEIDIDPETPSGPPFSTGMLLANVALSQGLFAVLLIAGAWYTAVPPAALGVALSDPLKALAVGVVVGLVLYAANAAGAASASALGYDYDEQLRELLTPETTIGWIVLLCAVLPIIAVFEELLFRAALIGALSTGFGISPWFLAGGSSAAFAFGHGAQGRLGILVTGLLGFVLAIVFIHTNSLLAVVVAHYLVNALEFVISGALGIEWG
jgi:membrane protease YdiL (CAAX protease family)